MYDINYIHGIEYELYRANTRIDELTAPYEFTVNGVTERVRELKDIKKILEDYKDQAVTVEMKKIKVNRKTRNGIQF